MNINILYEDEDILVVNKPAGLTVNKSETTKGDTLQDFLEKNYSFDVERSGIVHRIDKETSGLLLIAKNIQSFENLQAQFKERKVKKTYIALVHGEMKGDGEVRVPVGRLPWNRKRFGVLAGGRDAVTRYRVISNLPEDMSLLELYPETGRTHQIRVHLKYINHPIFGDEFYAGRKTARSDRKILSRLFLHASKISFTHPKTGKKMSLKSKLPQELLKIVS